MQLSAIRPTRLVITDNILVPHESKVYDLKLPAGTLASICPDVEEPWVCIRNGKWVLREKWGQQVQQGDQLAFAYYPGGGGEGGSDAGRFILTIAAIYIAIQFGQPWLAGQLGPAGVGLSTQVAGSLASALAVTAAGALVNALVPVNSSATAFNNETPSPTYSVGMQGNQARLEQPIPVLYGHNKTFPDFAAEPYSQFDRSATPTDDQYYYALLSLGQGQYDPATLQLMLDDTPLAAFGDVQYNVLQPGELPTLVNANVVSAPEVSGNTLNEGRYVGPFIACKPKQSTNKIQVDITFSRGLATYNASTGAPESKSVSWRVEYRMVNDFGQAMQNATGLWKRLPTETLSLAQTKPVRRTYEYTLPYVGRPQVRLIRVTPFDENQRVANTTEWSALRCFLQAAAPLCATATHIELVMRATEQLTGLSQRKIGVISDRMVRTWHPDTGYGALTATRNPAWALMDKWTNSVYGDGYAEEHIDFDTLYHYAQVWGARQDRFDGVFDQTYETHQADQMIAQAGRAAVFKRNGVMTLTRDEQKDLPRVAFTARNIDPGSVKINYAMPTKTSPDGVVVEYYDNRSWSWEEIEEPLPSVTTPVRAQRIRLFGVTGYTHARREAKYHAANAYYRRKFPSFSTEMEGMLATFGSAAIFQPSMPGKGVSGDVVDWDAGTLQLTLTEIPRWVSGQTHYVRLTKRDGELTTPIVATPGDDEFKVRLASAPDADDLVLDLDSTERTRYHFSAGIQLNEILRVLGAQNSQAADGRRTFSITGLMENSLVHTADNALLPVDGEIQDPIDSVGGDPGTDPSVLVPYLESFTGAAVSNQTSAEYILTFNPDGRLHLAGPEGGSTYLADQWLLLAPHDPSSLYEVRATLLGTSFGYAGVFDTWQNLNTARVWSALAVGEGSLAILDMLIEIRDVETETIQAYGNFYFQITTANNSGGGE